MIMSCYKTVGFNDESSIAELVGEILKMKDFSHMNILMLMGVALDSKHTPCLVMPYMSNGSLCEYLRKENTRKELLLDKEQPAEIVVKSFLTYQLAKQQPKIRFSWLYEVGHL